MRARGILMVAVGALVLCGQAKTAAAQTPSEAPTNETPAASMPEQGKAAVPVTSRDSVCLLIESAARAHGLPVEFFARVIWQESHFQTGLIGPRTRSGQHAQGIAQFMPGTAAERRLLDPFDPVQALPKSAEFLSELRGQFGNLGLAAAAYNAGPQRLRDWMAGKRTLPGQTRAYVASITGIAVDEWAKGLDRDPVREWPAIPNCEAVIALLKQEPNSFVAALEQRVNLVAASPWGVQLAAGFSRDRVLTAYARLAARYGEVLEGRDPSILSATLRNRGTRTFYQMRVGADTRESANSLCAAIRRAQGACMVLRNAGAN